MSAAPDHEATIRAWFDADGWRLEPDELSAALTERGADVELTVELRDEGADRRRREPLEEREPQAARTDRARTAADVPTSLGAPVPAPSRSSSGSQLPAKRDEAQPPANVVPITEAPSHGNVPPQNLEAEESVLGAMMISPGAISSCSEILDASGSEFYRESHARIWRAALSLDAAGEPVDAITLADALGQTGELESVGGKVRLHELAGLVPASANAAHYARIVAEMATLRGLIRAGGEISRLGWERPGEAGELVDAAEQIVFDLSQGRALGERLEHVSVSVKETFAQMTERAQSGSEYVGVPSGIHAFDELTQGFRPGNLILIAARPSMGKSGLLHTMLANIAVRQNRPCGLFTAEMSKAEVTQRLLAREGRVDGQRVQKPSSLRDEDWARLAKAADSLSKAPLYHDDAGQFGLAYIRSESRRLKQRYPDLALIAVDYIQLLSGPGDNRTEEISTISRGLKLLARDLRIPIVALSQLNRAVEQRADKRPILSDLRDSGSLEQDADLVAFLYRDEYYNEDSDSRGIAELDLAKHRNGPTDRVKIAFQKSYASFSDLAPGHVPS